MIDVIKPKFWDKKIGLLAILFLPLSLLVIFFTFIKKSFSIVTKSKIPIICIGNIYVGGTGKTPISILLANEISKQEKKKVVILRKYYKDHVDEHNLIKNKFNNLILNKNRIKGIKEAEKKGCDLIILDDGLQDYRIKKNLNVACFHENQLIGNGLVLPAGPLRERIIAIKNVDIAIINGKKNLNFEKKLFKINKNIEIFYSNYKPENIDEFKDKELIALAGIANPENFFELLNNNNLIIKEKLVFPDHYKFKKGELEKIIDKANRDNLKIIMTEKDFFKLDNFKHEKIGYLKVSLKINEKERLFDIIKKNL